MLKPKEIVCPGCNGSGEWYTECCDGSYQCSCKGQPVFMGECHVCEGRGFVIEGEFNSMANCESIKGMCYIGTSPYKRMCD